MSHYSCITVNTLCYLHNVYFHHHMSHFHHFHFLSELPCLFIFVILSLLHFLCRANISVVLHQIYFLSLTCWPSLFLPTSSSTTWVINCSSVPQEVVCSSRLVSDYPLWHPGWCSNSQDNHSILQPPATGSSPATDRYPAKSMSIQKVTRCWGGRAPKSAPASHQIASPSAAPRHL